MDVEETRNSEIIVIDVQAEDIVTVDDNMHTDTIEKDYEQDTNRLDTAVFYEEKIKCKICDFAFPRKGVLLVYRVLTVNNI